MGGAYDGQDGQLPTGLLIASGVAAGMYVLAALIVLGLGRFQGVPLTYDVLRCRGERLAQTLVELERRFAGVAIQGSG